MTRAIEMPDRKLTKAEALELLAKIADDERYRTPSQSIDVVADDDR